MKKLILLPILLLQLSAIAQDLRIVKILDEDRLLSKSCNTCQSNTILSVNIPINTVFIYLVISTNHSGHFKNINLLAQVKDLTATHRVVILGDMKPLIPLITGYESGGKVNFHVETNGHEKGHNMFEKGPGYACDYSKCSIDFPGGPAGFQVIQNKEASIYYFGLENPSDKEDIYFHIEAVAVSRDY